MLPRRTALIFTLMYFATCAAQVTQYKSIPGGLQMQPAEIGNVTLTGVVVNSVTGEPVPRALVQVNGMLQASTMTDASGKFEFNSLPESRVQVTARKPGFFSDLERRRPMPPKPVQLAPGMAPITVLLTPAGVITGHIITADGDPIEGVNVQLKVASIQQGRRQWVNRGGGNTDDDGAFRIAGLQPGNYYLFTNGSARSNDPDRTFAAAYYPGAPDMSGASPLQVRAGQTVVADLTLQREKAYRISGAVTGLQPGQSAFASLTGADGSTVPTGAVVHTEDGSFEMRRVPPGSYTLKITAEVPGGAGLGGRFGPGRMMPTPPQRYIGIAHVNVTSDLSGVTVALQPAANIPIEVRTDFENPKSNDSGAFISYAGPGRPERRFRQYVNVMLHREDSNFGYSQQTDENGAMWLRNLDPGRYHVEFMPTGGDTYVASATYGTVDLLHDDLVISGGEQQPIEIVVRDDAASISGTANCGGETCSVLIFSDGNRAFSPRPVYVGAQGMFQVHGLPPGSYRVYAFDHVDNVEYANPEAMKAYQAENVVLSAGQKVQVNVDMDKVDE